MSSIDFVSGLAASAQPVQRRRLWVELSVLVAIASVQLIGISYFFADDALDKAMMMDGSRIVFKVSLLGVSAVAFAGLALWSLAPHAQRLGSTIFAILGVIGLAGFIGFDRQFGTSIATTFSPEYGIRCILSILSLAMPVTMVMSLFMVSGASTQPNRTALLIGLSGGTWGAFTYALQCPFVNIYYLGVWYVGGIALVAAVARFALPRLARW